MAEEVKITPDQALDMEFYSDDRGEKITYREYFRCLLTALYDEGESFSGKRPFGNSGWDYGLVCGLGEIGAIPADEHGGPLDERDGHKFIFQMIEILCAKATGSPQ